MKNKILLSLITLLICSVQAFAQTIKVTGNVTSKSDGEALIGATVKEVGTQKATITDFDGNFTLEVNKGAQLVFSYVGFETLTVDAVDGMQVVMSDAAELQELVVTGYQVQRKADLTGAVGVVNVTELQKQNENNPMKALQGRVPGMNISADGSPSGAATVRIRGIGTLNNNDPLYIIDGVPTKAGMHELNGNDIESIQVLKDAASASIYGSRAANGVIIITTKKGKEGRLKVDFDASIAASIYTNKVKTLNAKEWGQAFWQANVNDGRDPNNNNLGYRFDWAYDANGNPMLNGIAMNNFLDDGATVHAGDTDWFDEVTRTGVVQNYNVSVSNGSEKGSSFFSMGYYKNLGTIKTSDFDRISARANSDYKLFDGKLTIGENFNINRTSGVDAPGGILENSLEFNPNFPIWAENKEYAQSLGAYSERENPLSLLHNKQDDRYTQWRTFGDVHIGINPFKNFNLRSTFGLDYTQKEQRFFTYPIANGKVTRSENAVESKQEHTTRWMWNAVATYNLEVGKHRGDAMLGMEINRHDYEWMSAKRYDYAILNPDYMWPSAGAGRQEAYGSGEGFSLVSYFGKVNYTYADTYMASVTVRHDGSSRFGKNNRYGTFPSFSLGWRITQEDFMKSTSSWLDDMKIRYSWGQTGNQEISNIARYTLFQSVVTTGLWGSGAAGTAYDITGVNGGYSLNNGYIRQQRGNEDIKWETTAQHNFGIDFAIMRNEIYGSFDWFHKSTKDILLFMNAVGAMGEGASQWINAGEMKNTGMEFTVGYRHKLDNGFSWDISGNIGSYSNEITKLPATVASKGDFGGNGIKSVVGHPMGAQVGYIYDGIFKSQEEVANHATQEGAGVGRIRYKDINHDGKITEDDRDWIYDPTPSFTWGLNIYLQYKDWDLTMFWQGVQGVDVNCFDYKKRTDFWANSDINVPYLNKGHRVLDAWSPSNTGSDIPMLTTADNNKEGALSSYYIENGSYAKLRNIQIGYNAPKAFVQKLKVERLRTFISAQNLLTIKAGKFTGVDPENPGFSYPIPLNLTFGVNVSF
ncbi:MAG: TonB-dependent receptor [Prevotellaceae bacterium]|nr:TonB-dependent receptor [Prevotellaceae bacterium]